MKNTIYLLSEKTPSKNVALSYLLGGIALAGIGWFVGGALALLLGAVGLIGIGIGLVQYVSKPVQTVLVSKESLVLRSAGKKQEIPLSAIEKIELVQVINEKVQRTPLQKMQSFTADSKTILVVTGATGQRIEIAASKFRLSDFESLLYVLQTQLSESNVLPDTAQYDKLIVQTQQYLHQEQQLKEALTKSLVDSFKTLYVPRGELYLKQHPEAVVLFKYQPNPNDGATYFLDKDYQPGLNAQAIQQSVQLILQAQKNIEIVDKRIEAYRQIADKLAAMKQEWLVQKKLAQTSATLQSLEAQNQRGQEISSNHDLQVTTFYQLKQLITDLNSAQDFGSTSILEQVDRILNQ
ncbi:MAG: hypothetical protein RMJ87_13615 [Cytophagales bacterium]|nr:CheF family chemotaxis protein [Bernardetiaceae bacterium]MDW8206060.1 hypothetical protein [Cytophagales bacterium]